MALNDAVEPGNGRMWLLPPAADKCQECASDHDPEQPHNAQSLYYGMARQMQGLPANWLTAMEHCSEDVRAVWTKALTDRGVDVAGGGINPEKRRRKA